MIIELKQSTQERTDIILKQWRGHANEFKVLHGYLCMTHGLDVHDSVALGTVFDFNRFAHRMDEMNAEAMKRINQERGTS